MPNITIEGPPINAIEIKKTLVKELTDAAVKAYHVPPQAIVVLIRESLPENVGIGGELLSERKK